VPRFPLKGGALVARGIDAGPAVARLLRQIENGWVERDFPGGAALAVLVDQALADEARQ
jgi:poly(A) polymerase